MRRKSLPGISANGAQNVVQTVLVLLFKVQVLATAGDDSSGDCAHVLTYG